jgi:hypothetical protein
MSNQSFASAVRSATLVGADNKKVPGINGIVVQLNVTAVPGVDTVQLVIEGKDPVALTYYTILSAVARAGAGVDVLTVGLGAVVTANVSANTALPDTYRIRVVHSAGTNFTYSVSVSEV